MTSLPLTPIESYLYEDDLPAHPCWQICRVVWKGAFQREPLEKAWADTVSRHPLWNAVVRKGPLGGLRWELGAAVAPPLHWSRDEPGREWPDWLPLDLEQGPGARLYVVEGGQRTACVLCVHHAVCDGLALLEVLEEAFGRYAIALGDSVELRPPATASALRRRGRFGTRWFDGLWLPLLQTAGIIAEAGLLRRTVAPLIPHDAAPSSGPRAAEWPAVVIRHWSEAETIAVMKAARLAKVSVSEMCMRDLQAAIGVWRVAQGVDLPEEWIRLGTAVSLRRRIGGSWPAANVFGIAIIDRQARSLANRERLLRRAKEDMALVDDWNLGYAFWMLLRLRRWWPGGIRAYARRPVVRMTMVMSYVGKVFAKTGLRREGGRPALPGAVLEEVQGFAPTRLGTCACLDVAIVLGRLCTFLNYDPRVLTRAQAEALSAEFAAQVERSVAGT
jgi:hypothetical protein